MVIKRIKGIKGRVVQAAVCVLALSGLAAGTGPAAREIPPETGGAAAQEISGVSGISAVRKDSEVKDISTASMTVVEIAGPLRIVSRIVSASEACEAMPQMLCPRRNRATVEDFFQWLNGYLENCGGESTDVVKAVCGLLDNQGEFYFGNYREEEIKVFYDSVYDDMLRNRYWKYSFYVPDQPKSKASIYISMGDGYIYGCTDSYFWCNDPQAVMPGFHSWVEEGKRKILDYLETAGSGVNCEIVYKGLVKKDELEQYMRAMHYSVSEKHADGKEVTWEAYVDQYLTNGYEDYFYAETAKNSYEKRQLCTWESKEGDSYSFAFSKSFQIEEDGSWKCGSDWKVVMRKGGESVEASAFSLDTEDYDWYGEMKINDYNFDGIPDIARIWGMPANWGGRSTTIYVWDEEERYHDAGTFVDVPGRAADIQTLYVSARGGYGYYVSYAYRYRDGNFVCISTLEEQFMEDDSVTYTVWDEAGNKEVYKDELPDNWKELWY